MRRIRRMRRMRRIRMLRIMGRGNGRPQALASVAYSYLRPSPFSGPWIHPTSPAHKPLSSFQPSFSFTFFLSPILSFHFLFLESFTFLELFSETWVETPLAHKKSSFSFWPFRLFFSQRFCGILQIIFELLLYSLNKEGGYFIKPPVPKVCSIPSQS